MKIDVEAKPSFGMATITLEKGESITAESGAMVAMSPSVTTKTRFNGAGSGALGGAKAALTGLARKFVAGETMFVNDYTSTQETGKVMLAPAMIGDVAHLRLTKGSIVVQATSYMASTSGISIDLIWGGFSMLFSGEGAFFLRCQGTGELLINSYGAIEKVEVDGSYRVDTGHLVAYRGALAYKLKRVGGLKSTLLSGEGAVLEFTGKGTLWLQTRNLSSLISWITPHLPA